MNGPGLHFFSGFNTVMTWAVEQGLPGVNIHYCLLCPLYSKGIQKCPFFCVSCRP